MLRTTTTCRGYFKIPESSEYPSHRFWDAPMTSLRLVPASGREALLGVPSDIASLERNSLLADDDLDLIGPRRPSSPDGTHFGASAGRTASRTW